MINFSNICQSSLYFTCYPAQVPFLLSLVSPPPIKSFVEGYEDFYIAVFVHLSASALPSYEDIMWRKYVDADPHVFHIPIKPKGCKISRLHIKLFHSFFQASTLHHPLKIIKISLADGVRGSGCFFSVHHIAGFCLAFRLMQKRPLKCASTLVNFHVQHR